MRLVVIARSGLGDCGAGGRESQATSESDTQVKDREPQVVEIFRVIESSAVTDLFLCVSIMLTGQCPEPLLASVGRQLVPWNPIPFMG
jgi:hypothetical protein